MAATYERLAPTTSRPLLVAVTLLALPAAIAVVTFGVAHSAEAALPFYIRLGYLF